MGSDWIDLAHHMRLQTFNQSTNDHQQNVGGRLSTRGKGRLLSFWA